MYTKVQKSIKEQVSLIARATTFEHTEHRQHNKKKLFKLKQLK